MDNFRMWREVDVFDVEYIEICVDSSVRMAYDYDGGGWSVAWQGVKVCAWWLTSTAIRIRLY